MLRLAPLCLRTSAHSPPYLGCQTGADAPVLPKTEAFAMDFKDISDCNEREMWEWMKAQYYGKDVLAGSIDFSPRSMAEVVGGEGLTYDEYLDIQFASENVCRGWFEICYRHAMGDYRRTNTAREGRQGLFLEGVGKLQQQNEHTVIRKVKFNR